MRLRATLLALSLALILALGQAQAAPAPVLITPDKVWTGDGTPHAGWSVLVDGGRIQAVGPVDKMTVPANAERIALPGKTV